MADWTQKLKLHHLQMLVALGEQGNLTQVAKMMNITQPALSKWLSQFEDEVGMVLVRTPQQRSAPDRRRKAAASARPAAD